MQRWVSVQACKDWNEVHEAIELARWDWCDCTDRREGMEHMHMHLRTSGSKLMHPFYVAG